MKTIRTAFKQDGFDFEQVARESDVAIYRKTKRSDTGGQIEGFEVIKIGTYPERTVFGVTFEHSECYPPSEKWGTLGWTCTTKQAAFDKMNVWLKAA